MSSSKTEMPLWRRPGKCHWLFCVVYVICGPLAVFAFTVLGWDWRIAAAVFGALPVIGIVIAVLNAINDDEFSDYWYSQVFLFAAVLLVAGLLSPWPKPRAEPEKGSPRCIGNLRRIGFALWSYAGEYDGFLPPEDGSAGLRLLVERGFLPELECYTCMGIPETELTEAGCSYLYSGGRTLASRREEVLVKDKPGNHAGGHHSLYGNGNVEFVAE